MKKITRRDTKATSFGSTPAKTKSFGVGTLLAAMIVIVLTVSARQTSPPGSGGQTVADVHQLSNQVRGVIRNVEKAGLPCGTQDSIVQRLREVDDALLTGNRSAAAGLLAAWIPDFRSMEGAGMLTAPQGTMLEVPLDNILPQIGLGSVKNPPPIAPWPPLPSCDATTGTGGLSNTSQYAVWQPSDEKTLVQTIVGSIPIAGLFLEPLVKLLYPDKTPSVDTLISSAILANTENGVSSALTGLQQGFTNFVSLEDNWRKDCATYGASSATCSTDAADVASTWHSMYVNSFPGWEPYFRLSPYQVDLLPFYAQYMNLYLAFLREGALAANQWWTPGSAMASEPEKAIKAALDENDKTRFIGYVDATYDAGLQSQPQATDMNTWATRNRYVRDMTLEVLDFRDMWPYLDPGAYPNGFPGFRLTRTIYSDPIGGYEGSSIPADLGYTDGPLQHLTVWTHPGDVSWKILKGVQYTGGPTSGPAVASPIMGAPVSDKFTRSDFDVRPGSKLGPIVTAEGYDAYPQAASGRYYVATLDFVFADGSKVEFNNNFKPSQYTTTWTSYPSQWHSFHYDDEVVASMTAEARLYDFHYWVDFIVFGFRYADSYYPSGEAINAGTGGCMTAPSTPGGVLDSSCAPTSDKFWTYYSPFRELRVWAGTQCLGAPSTVAGTQLQTQDCSHSRPSPQWQWTLSPGAGGGTITGVDSGLVVGSIGGQIQLQNKTGAPTQQWKTFTKVQGPVQSVGAGKCLGVSSPGSGTPVQIYTCNGLTPTQTWVYSSSMRTLSFPGWTQCLTATGTTAGSPVEIDACAGDASQQWIEDPSGLIINAPTGLVLNATGAADGSPVVLSSVPNLIGNPSQQWTWPMN